MSCTDSWYTLHRRGSTRISCTDSWYTLDRRGFNKDELHRQLVYTSPEGGQQGWVAQTAGIHLTEGGLTRMSCTDRWYTLHRRGSTRMNCTVRWYTLDMRGLTSTSYTDRWYIPDWMRSNNGALHRQVIYTWLEGVNKDDLHRQVVYTWPEGVQQWCVVKTTETVGVAIFGN